MTAEWTRADLPDLRGLDVSATNAEGATIWKRMTSPDTLLDEVVDHLNREHPKQGRDQFEVVIGGRLTAPESQFKRERDEALERAGILVHDLEWLQRRLGELGESAERAERERDKWRERAERAADEFNAYRSAYRAEKRAAKAEARPAPAVTGGAVEVQTCNQCGRDPNAPRGLSAAAVYYHRHGIAAGNNNTPADAGDFGRCIDYLGDTRPVWMSDVSPLWRLLVDHWGELLDLWRDPSNRDDLTGRIRELDMAPTGSPKAHVFGQEDDQ